MASQTFGRRPVWQGSAARGAFQEWSLTRLPAGATMVAVFHVKQDRKSVV